MSNRFVKIDNASEQLVRDVNTGSVLNVDTEAYASYKKKKVLGSLKLEAEKTKEARINNLEKEVSELKQGINQILEILKNGNN